MCIRIAVAFCCRDFCYVSIFFFNDTATTEIYTLSLHDALPILRRSRVGGPPVVLRQLPHRPRRLRWQGVELLLAEAGVVGDRKSTRLNSSHSQISYAVFCLKKKKNINKFQNYTQ